MRARLWIGGVLFAVAACATGCLDIVGYTERTLDAAGGGGVAGSGGTTATGGAGGATGGMGGTGAAPVCTPGDTQPCYDGAPGTEDVGVCKGGTQTCDAEGTGFGECIGEVTPSTEQCSKPGNEACTGELGCSDPIFVEQFGDEAAQVVSDLARAKGSDDMFIAGEFNGALKLGEKTLVSADVLDLYVARLNGSGEPVWAYSFSGPELQYVSALAATPDGGVVVSGKSSKPIDFGGGAVNGIFVVKLDQGGGHVWTKACIANPFVSSFVDVAADGQGDILAVGNIGGLSVNCGAGAFQSNGAHDIFLMKFSGSTGDLLWTKQFGDADDQLARAIAVDQADNVFLGGTFSGALNLGLQQMTDSGAGDAFLVKRSPTGAELWGKAFGDPTGTEQIVSIAVDSLAGPVVTGYFDSTIDLGVATLSSNGGVDMFVVSTSSVGTPKWGLAAGDIGSNTNALGVEVDSNDNVLLAGGFQGVLGFGSAGGIDSASSLDLFAAKLGSAGQLVWSKRFNSSGNIGLGGLAVGPGDRPWIAGSFDGAFDVGTGTVPPVGSSDIFVSAFSP